MSGRTFVGLRRANQRRWLAICGALIYLLGFLGSGATVAAPGAEYNPERVEAHVEMLAGTIGVRAAGTDNEGRAAAYIASEFIKTGLDTRIQAFPAWDYYSQNVVATKRGLDGGAGTIYVGAHYDSVIWGPGANDNASGTAVLLEVARLLATEPLSPTLTFIAFGSEERGLGGSGAFVASMSHLERLRARAMFNLDCIGWGTAQFVGVARSSGDELAQRTATHAAALGFPVEITHVENSDHTRFSAVDIPAILLYANDPEAKLPCGPHYHQASDTPDTLDPEPMARIAQILLSTVQDLANEPPAKRITVLWLPVIQADRQ